MYDTVTVYLRECGALVIKVNC